MDEATATKLIETLATGIDPLTGEAFDPDNPCQHPEVVRALCLAVRALDERRLRLERQKALPANVGKPASAHGGRHPGAAGKVGTRGALDTGGAVGKPHGSQW